MLKLSHSGSSILKECERKFFYRYLIKAEKDVDAPDWSAANKGSVFHKVWEDHKTKGKEISLATVEEEAKQYTHVSEDKFNKITTTVREVSPTVDVPKILAALNTYKELEETGAIIYKGQALYEVAWEIGFALKYTRGFIDAIFVNPETGDWWIQDKKTTSANLDDKIIAKLAEDPQVCHYASMYREIATLVKYKGKELDPDKFKGFIYSQIKFPVPKRKKITKGPDEKIEIKKGNTITIEFNEEAYKESKEEYSLRLFTDKETHIRNYFIPVELIDIKGHWERFSALTKKALFMYKELADTNKTSTLRNTSSCINNWGKACEYWSLCHNGRTFTECKKDSGIIIEEFKKG